jgi:uncharacterized protein (TIGR00369 family)
MSKAAVDPAEPARTTPPVPFFLLNGLEILELGEQVAICASEVRPWLDGTAELGMHAATVALADCVLNYPAAHLARDGHFPVSLGLRVDYWRSPPALGSRLIGSASVDVSTGEAFLVRGRIDGPDGELATATLRSLLVKQGASDGSSHRSVAPVIELVPPPQESEPVGPPPLDAILGLAAARLGGLRLLRAGPDSVELAARPGAALERTEGVVHGGAVPVLGQLGCAAALALARPAAPAPRRLDTTTEFLRPTVVEASMTVRARVVHRSRRVAVVHAELRNEAGKPTARVYETVLLEGPGEWSGERAAGSRSAQGPRWLPRRG